MNIRDRLAELREWADNLEDGPCLCGTPDGEFSCPYCSQFEKFRADFDAILADWPEPTGGWRTDSVITSAQLIADGRHVVGRDPSIDALEAVQAKRDTERRARERLETALRRVRDAISSVPEDAFGTGGNGVNIPLYPIRDELVDSLTKALTAEGED